MTRSRALRARTCTWDSQANRAQLRDGAVILGQLVPSILQLMLRDDAPELGDMAYPMIPN